MPANISEKELQELRIIAQEARDYEAAEKANADNDENDLEATIETRLTKTREELGKHIIPALREARELAAEARAHEARERLSKKRDYERDLGR